MKGKRYRLTVEFLLVTLIWARAKRLLQTYYNMGFDVLYECDLNAQL